MKIETAQSLGGKASEELIHRVAFENSERGEFVILSSSGQYYLQAAGEEAPFQVEFREGDEASHRTAEHAFTAEELEQILLAYWREDPKWKEGYTWVKTFGVGKDPWWKFW